MFLSTPPCHQATSAADSPSPPKPGYSHAPSSVMGVASDWSRSGLPCGQPGRPWVSRAPERPLDQRARRNQHHHRLPISTVCASTCTLQTTCVTGSGERFSICNSTIARISLNSLTGSCTPQEDLLEREDGDVQLRLKKAGPVARDALGRQRAVHRNGQLLIERKATFRRAESPQMAR